MTVIRLTRMGRNKKPFYRIVVTDSRKRRDSGWIESIGYFNPVSEPKVLKIDEERYNYWLSVGAKPSEKVAKLAASKQLKTMITNFIESYTKLIVSNPDSIKVSEEKIDDTFVEITINADSNDIGKLIGKNGNMINALKTMANGCKAKDGISYKIQVVSN